jgi:hypothetical protein
LQTCTRNGDSSERRVASGEWRVASVECCVTCVFDRVRSEMLSAALARATLSALRAQTNKSCATGKIVRLRARGSCDNEHPSRRSVALWHRGCYESNLRWPRRPDEKSPFQIVCIATCGNIRILHLAPKMASKGGADGGDICANCGSKRAELGSLMRCGRCQRVKYCSKEVSHLLV